MRWTSKKCSKYANHGHWLLPQFSKVRHERLPNRPDVRKLPDYRIRDDETKLLTYMSRGAFKENNKNFT